MRLLLCAATEFEIEPTIGFIADRNLGSHIAVLITGVGLAATTYSLTKQVLSSRPSVMIQAGVAGYLNDELPLTKTVVVKNESIGDLGVVEQQEFKTIFDLGLADANKWPWQNKVLPNTSEELLTSTALPSVNSVTVQEITTDKKRINYYKNKIGAEIETMEGSAVHYVGLMENIPFLQLRSLSNFAGERDKTKWQLKEAIVQLNMDVQNLLIKLINQ